MHNKQMLGTLSHKHETKSPQHSRGDKSDTTNALLCSMCQLWSFCSLSVYMWNCLIFNIVNSGNIWLEWQPAPAQQRERNDVQTQNRLNRLCHSDHHHRRKNNRGAAEPIEALRHWGRTFPNVSCRIHKIIWQDRGIKTEQRKWI